MRTRAGIAVKATTPSWLTTALGLVLGTVLGLGLGLSPAWAAPSTPDGVADSGDFITINDVFCPTATQCTAVDALGNEVTFNPRDPGTPTPVTLLANASSPGSPARRRGSCTALSSDGRVILFDPTDAADTLVVSSLADGPNAQLWKAIACPSTSQCTVVGGSSGGSGGFESTFDPAAPGTPTRFGVVGGGNHPLQSVSCPTTSQCTAGGFDGTVSTFDPAHPESATLTTVDARGAHLQVSCATTRRCTAVGTHGLNRGVAVTFDPSSPQSAVLSRLPGRGSRTDVDCANGSQCVAVTGQGQEVTFAPSDAANGAVTKVVKGVLSAVSCPTARQCTAVGKTDVGFVQVTFNPLDPGSPTPTSIGTVPASSATAD